VHLTTRNRNVLISACHFYHNTGVGVFYDHVNLHQSNIVGSHISYNGGGGVVTRRQRAQPAHRHLRHRGQSRDRRPAERECDARFTRRLHRRGGHHRLHDPAHILDSDGAGFLMQNTRHSLVTSCLIADRRQDRQPAPSLRIEGGEDNSFANNKLAHGEAK
jgi:hypothetical protein